MPQTGAPPPQVANQSTLSILCFPHAPASPPDRDHRPAQQSAQQQSTGRAPGAASEEGRGGPGIRAWAAASPRECREACDAEVRCHSWSFEPLAACRDWACGDWIKHEGDASLQDGHLCVLLDSFEPARYSPGSWAGTNFPSTPQTVWVCMRSQCVALSVFMCRSMWAGAGAPLPASSVRVRALVGMRTVSTDCMHTHRRGKASHSARQGSRDTGSLFRRDIGHTQDWVP